MGVYGRGTTDWNRAPRCVARALFGLLRWGVHRREGGPRGRRIRRTVPCACAAELEAWRSEGSGWRRRRHRRSGAAAALPWERRVLPGRKRLVWGGLLPPG